MNCECNELWMISELMKRATAASETSSNGRRSEWLHSFSFQSIHGVELNEIEWWIEEMNEGRSQHISWNSMKWAASGMTCIHFTPFRLLSFNFNKLNWSEAKTEWVNDIITVYLSTEPSTKSLVPTIDIKSASRWLWEIILNEWILY